MAQYNEKKKASNQKWDSQNLDRISVALPKGMKATILEHAARKGETMNGYVKRVIEEAISRENAE